LTLSSSLDALGALLVEHVRGADGVLPEDRLQGGVALLVRHVLQSVVQDAA
jgi:hypothetical protein